MKKIICLFVLALMLCGCAGMNLFPFSGSPKQISFEAMIVDNPERIGVFYCRNLFEKGTARGHEASSYLDVVTGNQVIVLTGTLKKWAFLQREMIVCGISDSLASGSGNLLPGQEMRVRMPLLDMRKPLKIRSAKGNLFELEGMPKGLPETLQAEIKPGETLVMAWFDRNRQLTIVRISVRVGSSG